ncbi:MAG: amidohydrolase family protein [Mycobacteriales bacterium]
MFVLRGAVVTMSGDGSTHHDAAVYVGDDGLIAAVTPFDPVPAGFERATRTKTTGVIYPGLIDMHNHLLYNSLPLWTEPARKVPWTSHNQWGGAATYGAQISAPARLLGAAAGRSLLRYVETRTIVGGTTSVQGNPRGATPPDGELVRNIDSEKFGTTKDFVRVRTLVAGDAGELEPYVTALGQRKGLIFHVAEGTDPKLGAEFTLIKDAGLVAPEFVGIHGTALNKAALGQLGSKKASLVWSPFSNLWLYGATADMAAAKDKKVRLCLGSDWAPSGTKNVLWELKVADLWNKSQPAPVFTDEELCRMVTSNPGDALAPVWPHPVGRVAKGCLADLVVMSRRHADDYRNLVLATERNVQLVVVGGRPCYGTTELMTRTGSAAQARVRVGRRTCRIDLGDPKISWESVLGDLEAVRANPVAAAKRVKRTLDSFGSDDFGQPGAPFVLLPDLPARDPDGSVAGPSSPPQPVDIPPLQRLAPDRAWFDAVDRNPFHGGLLSGLRKYAQ